MSNRIVNNAGFGHEWLDLTRDETKPSEVTEGNIVYKSGNGSKSIQFKIGIISLTFWERIWRRLFLRQRGINRMPRAWSNRELKMIGISLSGSVLNCSGWCDEDKQGGYYQDYFPRATEYHVSMREIRIFEGEDKSISRRPDIAIDLEHPISTLMVGQYDIVFCHTVLEHVFDIFTAFENLAALSRDVVIVVVPWCQRVHESHSSNDSYCDYWRIAPSTLKHLFEKNGLSLIYINGNLDFHASTYYLAVGSKQPDCHKDIIQLSPSCVPDGSNIYWQLIEYLWTGVKSVTYAVV